MFCELTGRRALVTGSSSGIGSAIALELARGGADIILHYAGDKDNAQSMQKRIGEIGQSCEFIQADFRDIAQIAGLLQAASEVDILVLNASVQISRPWDKLTSEDFHVQMNSNVLASLQLIQQMVPFMRKQRWGRIVTIGSVQELKPHPNMLIYSASKAAQTNMVKSLAFQLAADGITVNNVAPGVILTDRNEQALTDKDYARQVLQSIPLGFFGDKRDCAGLVRLLCSEEGRYITGQSLYVDGGKGL